MKMSQNDALMVQLQVPREVMRGDFIFATVRIQNTSNVRLSVSSRLNLFESDLRIFITGPNGKMKAVQGIAMIDSFPRQAGLGPDEYIEGQIGLFYTNVGLTFDQIGTYRLQAEYDPGGTAGLIRSAQVELTVHPATTQEERELADLTMNEHVGRSLALGDAGADLEAIQKLEEIADRFPERDAGVVARMVLGNTLARETKDLRTGRVMREADQATATQMFDEAFQAKALTIVARLACAVTPPAAVSKGPLLEGLRTHLERVAREHGEDEELARAQELLQQHSS